jgi:molecular chaperone GrpE
MNKHSEREQPEPETPEPDEAARPVEGDEDELTRLVRERDEYLESWRRSRADYQNLRRRLQSDIDAAVLKTRTALLSELLLVLDFLEMALRTEVRTDEARNLKVGIEMTRGQMLQFLAQQEVRAVPEGRRFDPAMHQAIEMIDAPDREPGDVVETVRPGYLIGPHVLRHAHVKVAAERGRSSASTAPTPTEAPDEID